MMIEEYDSDNFLKEIAIGVLIGLISIIIILLITELFSPSLVLKQSTMNEVCIQLTNDSSAIAYSGKDCSLTACNLICRVPSDIFPQEIIIEKVGE